MHSQTARFRTETDSPWIVWRLSDGKPGHMAQSAGLAAALARLLPVTEYSVEDCSCRWIDWLRKRFPAGADLPAPNLLIGAGHTTHIALLTAQRAYGGRSIVLMKPSIPPACFDLCIIPEHDGIRKRSNILLTRGVLNPVQRSQAPIPGQGLLLIGGPSKHHAWSDNEIVSQIRNIAATTPDIHWTLTTSRRTPDSFLSILQTQVPGNLEIVPVSATPPGWVYQHLACAEQVWVSEDSISMIYEALTAGAGVGLLSCPVRRVSRVVAGVRKLAQQGLVTAFADWTPGTCLSPPPQPFAEADRCARWIAEHWFGLAVAHA